MHLGVNLIFELEELHVHRVYMGTYLGEDSPLYSESAK